MYFLCRLLIEHGAKIEIENDEGQRPLEIYAKDPLAVEGDRDERLRDVVDLMKLYDEVSNSFCNKLPSLDEVVGRVSESFKGQGSIAVIKVRHTLESVFQYLPHNHIFFNIANLTSCLLYGKRNSLLQLPFA
jgi:hypothetical protein